MILVRENEYAVKVLYNFGNMTIVTIHSSFGTSILCNISSVYYCWVVFYCLCRCQASCSSGYGRWWSMHWRWFYCMVWPNKIAICKAEQQGFSLINLKFVNAGESWSGLSWISCFWMMRQLLPLLIKLLFWNIVLWFMTELKRLYWIGVWVCKMVMLYLMPNIHAGILHYFKFILWPV